MVVAFGPFDHEPMDVNFECAARNRWTGVLHARCHCVSIRLIKNALATNWKVCGQWNLTVGSILAPKQAANPVPDQPEAIITPTCGINRLRAEAYRNVKTALQVSFGAGALLGRGIIAGRYRCLSIRAIDPTCRQTPATGQ